MMAEYINREAAIDRLEKLFQLQAVTARVIMEAIPSADVQPVRHGRWGNRNECSECGFQPWFERDIHTLNFCPNCGAKMDGEADG